MPVTFLFLGSVREVESRERKKAKRLVLWSLLGPLLPFFVVALIALFTDTELAEALKGMVRHGELFLYATATVSPLFSLVIRQRKDGVAFPHVDSILALTLGVIVVATVAIVADRIGEFVPSALVIVGSAVIYALSVWLQYCGLAFDIAVPEENPIQHKTEEAVQKYEDHKRKEQSDER